MKRSISLLSISVLLIALSNFAVADSGNADRGKALYGACSGCHGADGMGNAAIKAPRLAGQFDWYIATQLRNFKSGLRGTIQGDAGGAMMRPMASMLADEQAILDVSAYLASL